MLSGTPLYNPPCPNISIPFILSNSSELSGYSAGINILISFVILFILHSIIILFYFILWIFMILYFILGFFSWSVNYSIDFLKEFINVIFSRRCKMFYVVCHNLYRKKNYLNLLIIVT